VGDYGGERDGRLARDLAGAVAACLMQPYVEESVGPDGGGPPVAEFGAEDYALLGAGDRVPQVGQG
jgi:hypothetical protein